MKYLLKMQPFEFSLLPSIHPVLIRFAALLMATSADLLDQELRLEEDEDLNLTYVGPAQTTKPVGINSLRQWGNFVLEDGRFKGKTFLDTIDNHPEYVRYIINRRVTAKSLVSFQNFCRAVESAKVQKKMEGKTVKPDNEMTQGPILPKAAPKGASSSASARAKARGR